MTRLQIRSMIRKRLGETTASFWSDAELNTWINDSCRDLAFRSKCLRGNTYLTFENGVQEYTLSTLVANILSINEFYYKQDGTNYVKIDATSRTELDKLYSGWQSAPASEPIKYWYDREEDIFGLYPAPELAVNEGLNYGRIFYTLTHADMNTDTEEPTIPVYLQPAICDYVVAYGFEQRGWGDKANDAWQKYFQKIHDYQVERHREKEDEEIIMRNYRS